ncbi:MAG TPA: hypothetical protein VGN57_00535 [Pirellulaceae bacterium]|jgi:hypothetical protein|nr:hypothetical protein [Pirellulaceae bacterium]
MSSPYQPGLQNPYGESASKPAPAAPTPYPYYEQPPAKSWVWLALVAGHLGAAAYFTIALLMIIFIGLAVADARSEEDAAAAAIVLGILAAMCGGLGLVAEIVTIGMHLRHKWAWFAGLAMFGLYLPSLFLPIGALGMCGLLMTGSRREFRIG